MQRIADVELPQGLIDRARDGDGAAHTLIYRAYAPSVYTLVRRLVPDAATADDLLQEVFVEMLRNIAAYQARGPFGAWVRSIAVSKCMMHLRSPWHRLRLGLPEAQTSGQWQLVCNDAGPERRASAERDLEQALVILPAVSRAVLWLHDVEGMTHAEIAKLFGRTQGFSKSQLSRAHARLRAQLSETMERSACTSLSTSC